MIRRIRVCLCAVLLCGLCASLRAEDTAPSTAGDAGWSLLLANQYTPAQDVFHKRIKNNPSDLMALWGLYQVGILQGDAPQMRESLEQILRVTATQGSCVGTQALTRYLRLMEAEYESDTALPFLETLLARKDLHPALRCLLNRTLRSMYYERRAYDKMRACMQADGYVRTYARVIGAWRDRAGEDIDRRLPPDDALLQDAYTTDEGVALRVIKTPLVDLDGELNLYKLFSSDPDSGVAWVGVNLVSEKAQEILLEVDCAAPVRVWLRGMPVFRSDQFRTAYKHAPRRVQVRLAAGDNPLFLKTSSYASPSVSVLSLEEGVAQGVQAGALPETVAPLSSISGMVLSSPVSLPDWVDEDSGGISLWGEARALWLARCQEEYGLVQDARTRMNTVLAQYPDSAVLLLNTAAFRLRESRMGRDSATRLKREARECLAALVKLDPPVPAALLAMAQDEADRKQLDAAIRHAQQAITVAPEFATAHWRLAGWYRKKTWDALAETSYETALRIRPEWTLRKALGYYRSIGRLSLAQEAEQKAWEARAIAPVSHVYTLCNQQKWDEAQRTLEEFAAAVPEHSDWILERQTDIALDRGDRKLAFSLLQKQYEKDPRDTDVLESLATLHLRAGETAQALEWFRRLQTVLNENDALPTELRERIRRLEGRELDLAKHDLLLDADAAVPVESDGKAHYGVQLRVVIHRIHADRSVESFHHEAIRIFDREGMSSLSELPLFMGDRDIRFLRTIDPDGQVYTPSASENLDLEKMTSMYGVRPGSVLEYAYRETGEGGTHVSWQDSFRAESFEAPIGRARYVLQVPSSLVNDLSVVCVPETWLPTVTQAGDDTVFVWEQDGRPVHEWEAGIPDAGEVLASVRASIAAAQYCVPPGWTRYPEPVYDNEEIRRLASAIAAEAIDSDAAIVKAVHGWVARNISDSGSAVTARDVLAERGGNTRDKARLCRALLASLGIESNMARGNMMLSNPAVPPKARRAGVTAFSAPHLLHVSFLEDPDLWLRFHSHDRFYDSDALGAGVRGALAMEVSQNGLTLSRMCGDAVENANRLDVSVIVQEDGTGVVTGRMIYGGQSAGNMRVRVMDPQKGPLFMTDLVHRLLPRLELESMDYPHGESGDSATTGEISAEPFIYRFEGLLSRFAREENGGLTVPAFVQEMGARRYLTALPRAHDMRVSGDGFLMQRITLVAPPHWAFATLPPDTFRVSDFGLFATDTYGEGRRVTITRIILLPAQTVPVSEYPVFHQFLSDCEASQNWTVGMRELTREGFGTHLTEVEIPGWMERRENVYQSRKWPEDLPRPEAPRE